MRQGPSERSHANQYPFDELETSFNVDHLLESLILNQYMQPTASLNLRQESSAPSPVLDLPRRATAFDPSGAHTSIKIEECVDLNPLLFDNSDEFFSKVENIESSCDTTEKGTFNYYVINKNENPAIIYTPDNLSAAPSPSSVFDCATDDVKMEGDYFSPNSVGLLQFEFGDSTVGGADSNSIFNSSVYGSNVMISDTKRDDANGDTLLFDTPENSNGPSGFTMRRRGALALPSLPLTLFDLPQVQAFNEEINTPDIINCIIESEKIDFSKGIQPKQLTLSNLVAEEIPSTSSSIIEVGDDYQTYLPASGSVTIIPSIPSKGLSAKSKSRKRFYRDDSDEEFVDDDEDKDYVPPTKAARKGKNWDNFQTGLTDRVGKRGRPPKRAKSISSDDYSQLDPEEARYREMRDRNNEASRRSRYKRKKKEELFSNELEDLETENVKLKAQVEELQKTVDKYRDNLMQVMLSKR